jgi:hypothetical protein
MSDAKWSSQLAEAIDSIADTSQVLAFPSRCKDALEVGLKQGMEEQASAQLLKLLEPLRAWRALPTPDFPEAFAQWLQLHAFDSPSLPDAVLASALRIFPTYEGHDGEWLKFALSTRRLAVISDLLDLDLLPEKTLVQQANTDPAAVCKSRLIEALTQDSPAWESSRLFAELCRQVARATSSEEIGRLVQGIMNCYAASSVRKADTQVLSLLSSAPEQVSQKVLDELFRRPQACLRLVDFLKTSLFDTKARGSRSAAQKLLTSLTSRALDVIAAGSSPGSETAGLAIASLQLAALEDGISHGTTKAAIAFLTQEQTVRLIKCLAKLAHAKSSSASTPAFVTGYDIASAFASPSPAPATSTPATTSTGPTAVTTAHEAGTRRILADLARLSVMHQDPAARDEAIRLILFNNGVREFGSPGEELPFNSLLHETRDAAVFPGDPVKIIRPGQEIVAAGTRHVLVKAGVAAATDAST